MINKPKNLIKQAILMSVIALLALPSTAHAKVFSLSMIMPMSAIDIHNLVFNKEKQANNSYIMNFVWNKNTEPEVTAEDIKLQEDLAKAARIDAYFEKRNMPLAGYGMEFVIAAEKYDIDWRLLPAIGVRESSGGLHLMNNNPFGWGSAKIKFTDFSEAIDVVAMNLGGGNPNTARYYKEADTQKKLWYYNGTVMPSYPGEVMDIMDMF